jgi:hypothetical protein
MKNIGRIRVILAPFKLSKNDTRRKINEITKKCLLLFTTIR